MPRVGLEPTCLSTTDLKSVAAASYATAARIYFSSALIILPPELIR